MAMTTPDHHDPLLPLLQTAIPTITACTILESIVQANAQGCRVAVHPPPHTESRGELFVKRVVASTGRQWNDLRRTLLYGRTEVRFYREILPLLEKKGMLGYAPTCHVAQYSLEGLIDEDEVAYHAPSTTMEPADVCNNNNRGAFLVLDSMDMNAFHQDSPLSCEEALQCLQTVAQLHAAAWQDTALLQHANRRMARGSYHLQTRNPKELEGIVDSWKNFLAEFGDHNDIFSLPQIQNLGKRMYDMAHYVSNQLKPQPSDPFATLCHGDFKAMNVFLSSKNGNAVMIDFASTGVGLGMSDVAMHIIHAVVPSNDNYEDDLVDGYLEALNKARKKYNTGGTDYPREVALRHYKLACVDYVRFIMGRFWKSATKESFEEKRESKNTTLINRNIDAAVAWIGKVDRYLQELEDEKAGR